MLRTASNLITGYVLLVQVSCTRYEVKSTIAWEPCENMQIVVGNYFEGWSSEFRDPQIIYEVLIENIRDTLIDVDFFAKVLNNRPDQTPSNTHIKGVVHANSRRLLNVYSFYQKDYEFFDKENPTIIIYDAKGDTCQLSIADDVTIFDGSKEWIKTPYDSLIPMN